MSTRLSRRLDTVQKKLNPVNRVPFIVISDADSEDVQRAKLARWRAGEEVKGFPSTVEDRENVDVILIRREFVDPMKVRRLREMVEADERRKGEWPKRDQQS